MTEKQTKKFFKDVLEQLGIKTYHCQKLKGRGCATITVLDVGKARQFLKIHGQTKPGPEGYKSTPVKLQHMGRPIYCSQSNKPPDEFELRCLKKEESDRYAASQSRKPKIVQGKTHEPSKPSQSRRAFDISSLKCGQWSYVGSDLAFVSHSCEPGHGRMIFGDRNLLIKLGPQTPYSPSNQVDISYSSIESFTVGPPSNPSVTFSLKEAPRFFANLTSQAGEANSNTLNSALRNLGLNPSNQTSASRQTSETFTRKRITALSTSHEMVAPSCLCYRVMLSSSGDVEGLLALRRFPEIPDSISWSTSAITDVPFPAQMTALNSALTGKEYSHLPFEIKFQMLKLARNGYTAPLKVLQLLAVVADHLKTRDSATVVHSVKNLADDMPFAGPNTEASQLSIPAMSEYLVQNQESIVRGESYLASLAEEYDHITSVHKATVTPAGTYLSGPEQEVKNRVLRKYSAYPNHFLSVSFLDEDGEPVRLDRKTSGEEIYHARFKKALEGVINIAGRGYEVRELPLCHASQSI